MRKYINLVRKHLFEDTSPEDMSATAFKDAVATADLRQSRYNLVVVKSVNGQNHILIRERGIGIIRAMQQFRVFRMMPQDNPTKKYWESATTSERMDAVMFRAYMLLDSGDPLPAEQVPEINKLISTESY